MKKIVLTGGTYCGKTKLWNILKDEYPGFHFVEDPAMVAIQAQQELEKTKAGYTGIFPWNNSKFFEPLVLAKSLILESQIPDGPGVAIFDTSLIDRLAYCKIRDHESLIPEISEHIKSANYDLAFMLDPIKPYKENSYRRETESQADLTYSVIRDTYKNANIKVIEVPNFGVIDDRVAYFIKESAKF